jgi:hypothetical protein
VDQDERLPCPFHDIENRVPVDLDGSRNEGLIPVDRVRRDERSFAFPR